MLSCACVSTFVCVCFVRACACICLYLPLSVRVHAYACVRMWVRRPTKNHDLQFILANTTVRVDDDRYTKTPHIDAPRQ